MDLSRIEWRKASYSANGRGQCVEVGTITRGALVRDSKDPDGPILAFTFAEWMAFTRKVKIGEVGPR